jgi:ABC-type transport system involved in cytochrome bd biosynthesis fused ATPase/permease subunit
VTAAEHTTLVVASNRPPLARAADLVVARDGGRIVASATTASCTTAET